MPRALVLGAGMVGRVIAADLADDSDFSVSIADVSADALRAAAQHARSDVETIQTDLSDAAVVTELVGSCDVVLGAMASRIGFQTLRAVIEAGRPFCDICFMPEDAWDLDELARDRGVTAVFDMGVAPGMSNLLAAHAAGELDRCDRIDIYVGGLPQTRRWPFEYKAAFSPHDVIEEYTRPARLVEHGEIVIRAALSEPELINLPGVGTLESFNTDGLRSLAETSLAPFMREKTLRYPGHIELMRAFRETGLFSETPVEVGGATVRPLDVISTLMFPHWTYEEDEGDLTVMRVVVEGQQAGQVVRITWDLLDHYDRDRRETSMARTTGFPCAIVARMIASGDVPEVGVLAPERLGGRVDLVERLLGQLEQRGVCFSRSLERIE